MSDEYRLKLDDLQIEYITYALKIAKKQKYFEILRSTRNVKKKPELNTEHNLLVIDGFKQDYRILTSLEDLLEKVPYEQDGLYAREECDCEDYIDEDDPLVMGQQLLLDQFIQDEFTNK